ncbi:MAG TPA: hypothetical protein VG407_09855 [Caulobacteraceae bacterium]|nr:hypothetical protein [Caulobacteraceae bacterium]
MDNTHERRAKPAQSAGASSPLTATEIRRASEGLGAQLKVMFANVASEPLPHEIVDLVDALEGRAVQGRGRRRSH